MIKAVGDGALLDLARSKSAATDGGTHLRRRYLVAMAFHRDAFQLPGALAEADVLAGVATDYYLPDILARWLGPDHSLVRKWHDPKLPSALVRPSLRAAWLGIRKRIFKENETRANPRIDREISRQLARLARRQPEAGLLSYNNYTTQAFRQLANRPRIIFQYHPHPDYVREVLTEDYARFPEIRWSFENAADSQPRSANDPEKLEEWRHADAFLCASSMTLRSLRYIGSTAPIEVVPYGVKAGYAQNDRIDLKEREACTFLFVGQGVQRKGLHHLLHAWRQAGLQRSQLVVVSGRLDPGITPLLDQPRVVHRSWLSDAELRDAFARANVFVMPSLVEGFGLVYLEALAAGCFCIGTTNTGLPDLHLPSSAVDYAEPGMLDTLVGALADAERRWCEGELDPRAIAELARTFTMDGFRRGVREGVAKIEYETNCDT